MLSSLAVTDLLNEIASNSPAPGGGSVSALAASLGSSLTSMVCRLTIGKKKYADVQEEIEKVLKQSEELREKFTAMIDEDTMAYHKVMAAYGLPKETEEQKAKRTKEIQAAMKTATLVPLKLIELCREAMPLVKIIVERGNKNSLSDAGVAALMLHAGCEGAKLNVNINLAGIQDTAFVEAQRTAASTIQTKTNDMFQDIISRINEQSS